MALRFPPRIAQNGAAIFILTPPRTLTYIATSSSTATSARSYATTSEAAPGALDVLGDEGGEGGRISKEELLKEYKEFKRKYGSAFRNVQQPTYLNMVVGGDRQQGKTPRDRPFNMNPFFKSKPILGDSVREEIYKRVVNQGKSVRLVSSELGVTMERVAAVVRMMTIQKKWEEQEKRTVPFLQKAIYNLVPVTEIPKFRNDGYTDHESINDLPEHPKTTVQLFQSVPESRLVNRADAGAAFGVPPADQLIPHPELVAMEQQRLAGLTAKEIQRKEAERERLEDARKAEEARRAAEKKAAEGEIIEQGRWRWRLREGKVGHIGARYGVPHQDRKKGQVKIPTRVE